MISEITGQQRYLESCLVHKNLATSVVRVSVDNVNMFEVILKEIKENFNDDFLLNLERLRMVLKNPNNHLETIKFISTNTYIELEELIKKLLKETDIRVEVVSNEDNTAYLLSQKLTNFIKPKINK